MAINWESKIILVKPETTYGVDPAPTGTVNAMLLTNVELRPMEGQDVARNLERPFMGAQEEIPTGIHVVLSGSFELVGSGALGVAPGWGPLLRLCGVAETITPTTKVEYTPVSDNHESGGVHFWIGPTRHIILGARATGVMTLNAQGIPIVRVTITGLFTTPADQTRPAVDLSAFQRPQVANKVNTPLFTIAGTGFAMRGFTFDLACQVEPRLLVGREEIIIVDRNETISMTVEAVPMATYNPYSAANTGTPVAIALTHGTAAGKRVKLTAGQAVQKRLAGFENSQKVTEWPLVFSPVPTSAGNDQWKITLD